MKKKPAVPQFIEEERDKGSSDDEIQHKLLEAGWHIDIIHSAMKNDPSDKIVTSPPVLTDDSRNYKETAQLAVKSPFFIGGVLVLLILLAIFI